MQWPMAKEKDSYIVVQDKDDRYCKMIPGDWEEALFQVSNNPMLLDFAPHKFHGNSSLENIDFCHQHQLGFRLGEYLAFLFRSICVLPEDAWGLHILGIEMCLYDVQKSQVIILLQEGNGWKNSCALNLIWLDHLLNFIMFEVGIECKCCQ